MCGIVGYLGKAGDSAQLRGALEALKKEEPNLTASVRADESLDYGAVMKVVRTLHAAKITRMALITQSDK